MVLTTQELEIISPEQLKPVNVRAETESISNLFPEEEEFKSPVRIEYLRDDQQRVVDVGFRQNGQAVRLKEVIPGNYTINILDIPPGYRMIEGGGFQCRYDAQTNSINMAPERFAPSPRVFLLVLVHEASHYENARENKEFNTFLFVRIDLLKDQFSLFYKAEREGRKCLTPELWDEYEQRMQKLKVKYPKIYDFYMKGLREAFDFLAREDISADELKAWEDNRRQEEKEAELVYSQQDELKTWERTIHALNRFREKGINLYQSTRERVTEDMWTGLKGLA